MYGGKDENFKNDKDKPKTFSQEVNKQNIIKSPAKLNIVNNDLSRYLLTTFISIADEEDYDKFMAYVANDFYSKNYFFLNSLKNIGNNDMDTIWENLNLFLYNNNLGFSEVLFNEVKLEDVIQSTNIYNLNFIPAGSLCLKDPTYYEDNFTEERYINNFKNKDVLKMYDFIVLDTPPRVSKHIETLVLNRDYILMIINPDPASFSSLMIFNKFFEKSLIHEKNFIIVNKVEPTKISEDFSRIIKLKLKSKVLELIPKDSSVVESEGKCMPVIYLNPDTVFSVFIKKSVVKFLDYVKI